MAMHEAQQGSVSLFAPTARLLAASMRRKCQSRRGSRGGGRSRRGKKQWSAPWSPKSKELRQVRDFNCTKRAGCICGCIRSDFSCGRHLTNTDVCLFVSTCDETMAHKPLSGSDWYERSRVIQTKKEKENQDQTKKKETKTRSSDALTDDRTRFVLRRMGCACWKRPAGTAKYIKDRLAEKSQGDTCGIESPSYFK